MERHEQNQIQAFGEDCVNAQSKVSWGKPSGTRKRLLLAIVRDLNERVLTLLEKDLHVVGHESKVETRNRLGDSSIWRKIKGDLI